MRYFIVYKQRDELWSNRQYMSHIDWKVEHDRLTQLVNAAEKKFTESRQSLQRQLTNGKSRDKETSKLLSCIDLTELYGRQLEDDRCDHLKFGGKQRKQSVADTKEKRNKWARGLGQQLQQQIEKLGPIVHSIKWRLCHYHIASMLSDVGIEWPYPPLKADQDASIQEEEEFEGMHLE